MIRVTRTVRLASAAVLATLLAAGCSSGDGVSQGQLEESIKTKMNDQHATDSPVSSVSCPRGLKAEVGDAVTCTATTEDGKTVDVESRVDEVDGGTIRYSMRPKPAADATGVQG